jgi:hypothetical protein
MTASNYHDTWPYLPDLSFKDLSACFLILTPASGYLGFFGLKT